MPDLLQSARGWHSLDIDYHPPRVERLYRPWGAGRLMLHRIAPCSAGEALVHPHPWPCAVRVLTGPYEMGLGSGTRLVAHGPLEYEMTDPTEQHYVRPLEGPTLSVMVTGAPWPGVPKDRPGPLGTLNSAAIEALLSEMRGWYPQP